MVIIYFISCCIRMGTGIQVECNSVTYSGVILLVNFNGLVSLCRDQSAFRVVEHASEDSRLAVQRPGLHGCVDTLEIVSGPPVPHVDSSIVGCV